MTTKQREARFGTIAVLAFGGSILIGMIGTLFSGDMPRNDATSYVDESSCLTVRC